MSPAEFEPELLASKQTARPLGSALIFRKAQNTDDNRTFGSLLHSFVCYLFNQVVSVCSIVSLNGNERRIGKDAEGSGCGLTQGTIPVFGSEDWKKDIK
jgi:hypothetical protein